MPGLFQKVEGVGGVEGVFFCIIVIKKIQSKIFAISKIKPPTPSNGLLLAFDPSDIPPKRLRKLTQPLRILQEKAHASELFTETKGFFNVLSVPAPGLLCNGF